MPGFSGQYHFTVDEKGRIIIPAPFREIIKTNYGNKLYITNAPFDKCIHIYPQEEWLHLEGQVKSLPRTDKAVKFYMRRVVGSAYETEIDKQGRTLIPQAYRENAGINGEIVIVGQIEKIELWDRNEWDMVMDVDANAKQGFEDRLSELGI